MAQVQEIMTRRYLPRMQEGKAPLCEPVLAVLPVGEANDVRIEMVGELVEKDGVVVGVLHPQPVTALVIVGGVDCVQPLHHGLDDGIGEHLSAPDLGKKVEILKGLSETLV